MLLQDTSLVTSAGRQHQGQDGRGVEPSYSDEDSRLVWLSVLRFVTIRTRMLSDGLHLGSSCEGNSAFTLK